MTLAHKAKLLLHLHRTERPLVLPNAWDVASARVFEKAGFPAIATTSAGIANALGYPDVQRISRDEMLEVVRRIARAVHVPVTADMEAGYGDAAATARGVIEAGAVGFNLEDSFLKPAPGLTEIGAQCDAIRSAVEAGKHLGVNLVINARTDVYLGSPIPAEQRLEEAVRRLRAYADAGASCLFAPGVRDEQTITALVKATDLPLNILATDGAPSIARMRELGVARVSIGSGAMRATMGLTKRIADELRQHGTFNTMVNGAISYVDANALFER